MSLVKEMVAAIFAATGMHGAPPPAPPPPPPPVVVQAPAPAPLPPAARPAPAAPAPASSGWAIPWRVVKCESGGNYRAQNPRSSASGAYQMIQSTANTAARAIGRRDLVGTPARLWPPHVQDAAARWLWDGGRGRNHWKACL